MPIFGLNFRSNVSDQELKTPRCASNVLLSTGGVYPILPPT